VIVIGARSITDTVEVSSLAATPLWLGLWRNGRPSAARRTLHAASQLLAQNTFGAKLRNRFTVTVQCVGDDNSRAVKGPTMTPW
jgi:hypothetical protein